MATIKDVARLANVSISTVSEILNGKLAGAEDTRKRIFVAMKKVDYIPNVHARKIITKKSENIAFFMDSNTTSIFSNLFYSRIFEGVDHEIKKNEYNLLFSTLEKKDGKKIQFPKMIKENNIDGILLAGYFTDIDFIIRLKRKKIPIVLIDNQYDDLNCVLTDSLFGAYTGTKYLHSLGHKRIGFINGPIDHTPFKERLEGYRGYINNSVLERDENLIDEAPSFNGYEPAKRLMSLAYPPTAIFAANDDIAVTAMKYIINEAKLTIPGDISIIGFDDTVFAEKIIPSLTTIHVHKKEMGIKAVRRLIELINNRRSLSEKIVLKPEIIIRESSRAPGK